MIPIVYLAYYTVWGISGLGDILYQKPKQTMWGGCVLAGVQTSPVLTKQIGDVCTQAGGVLALRV